MSSYIHKSHNVTVLLYHLVFPAKYRRAIIDPEVDQALTGCGKSLKRMQCVQFSNIQRGSTRNYISIMHVFVDKYYRPCPFSAAL
jgi:putative transposase